MRESHASESEKMKNTWHYNAKNNRFWESPIISMFG